MKVSPISGPGATIGSIGTGESAPQTTMVDRMRALKMNTNANPTKDEPLAPAALAAPESLPETAEPAPATTIGETEQREDTQPLSPQFAAIAKQRRFLQQEKQAFEREKAEFLATRGEGIPKSQLTSSPLRTLLDSGVTFEQLTEEVLNYQSGNPDLKSLKENILKEVQADMEKKFTDREQQTIQQYLDTQLRDAKTLIAQGEDYEAVKAMGLLNEVPRLIKTVYETEGKALTAKEALEHLEEIALEDAKKLATLKKVQSQLAPPAPAPQPPQQQRQMRTLTNRDTAQPSISRRARALNAFYGNKP